MPDSCFSFCRSYGYIIEDTFLSSTKVIELGNFSCGRFIVVFSDLICIFAMWNYFSFPPIFHFDHGSGEFFFLDTKLQNYQLFDE